MRAATSVNFRHKGAAVAEDGAGTREKCTRVPLNFQESEESSINPFASTAVTARVTLVASDFHEISLFRSLNYRSPFYREISRMHTGIFRGLAGNG